MFDQIIKKYPFTEPLIRKLKQIYTHATPKERKIINEFLNVFYEALDIARKKDEFYKRIYKQLKEGVSLKEIVDELKADIRTEETVDVDKIVNKLVDCCDKKMIKTVIEILLDEIPESKQEKVLATLKTVVKNE